MCGDDFEQDVRPIIQAFTKESPEQVIHKENKDGTEPAEDEFLLEVKDGKIVAALNHGGKFTEEDITEDLEHKALRNRVLTASYRVFSRALNTSLPWGILTGVRPTKLCMAGLEEGKSPEEIKSSLMKNQLVTAEKADLGIETAQRELRLLKGIDLNKTYSIYVGIPFCPSICSYCSFSSFPYAKYGKLADDYVNALSKEIEASSRLFPNRLPTTVYFGGGTPTTLSADQLRFIIRRIKECFPMQAVTEFTVEAGRADTITPEKLHMLKEEGVTRISINPQSMRAKTLELIGRRHTPEQVEEAFEMARKAGHDNINMDIILGLSKETPEDVAYTLSKIKELSPDSLTVHMLARKRAARLNTERESFIGMDAVDVPGQFTISREFAKENGYNPYYLYRQKYMAENMENIGYAKEGKECLYNVLIMEEKQVILALGAGASSKFVFESENRFERVENVKNVTDYIDRIDEMIMRKADFIAANAALQE